MLVIIFCLELFYYNTSIQYGDLPHDVNSAKIGQLYGRIFLKQYGTDSFSITLHNLLSWSYWAVFLKIYCMFFLSVYCSVCLLVTSCTGGSSKVKDGLPENCKEACFLAITLLEELSRQLRQGDITIKILKKIRNNEEQINKLCEATELRAHESTKSTKSHFIVKQRLDEYQVFKEHLEHLKHLYQNMIHSNFEG